MNWGAFSWEAFATLATGFAAVAAAWAIGRRQVDILAKQNLDARDSSNRDFQLREQTMRIDLLNHRYDVIEEFRRIWGQWQREMILSDDDWNALRMVFHKAQLLFPSPIVTSIQTALTQLATQKREQARADQNFQRGHDDVARQHLDKSFAADDAVIAVMEPLLSQILGASRVVD